MAGGIQLGTEAGSEESKKLDGDVKNVAEAIVRVQGKYFYERGHRVYDQSISSKQVINENAIPEFTKRGILVGCVPDGGMWFDGPRSQPRTLKYVFEAKFQDVRGNAIERWNKNHFLCSNLFPDVKYITFMTGPGAATNEVLWRHGETMTSLSPNCIFYYSPQGFTQEGIFNIMISNLGLNLMFEDIKPYLNVKMVSTFETQFETVEERTIRIEEENKRNELSLSFSQFAQNPEDPLYPVWHRLPKDTKPEAREIALDMLQEGYANAVIATELVECFLKH
jgi:hypothetical protein